MNLTHIASIEVVDMYQRKKQAIGIFSILMMLVLIFDTRTAILGAGEGIQLCIQTAVPSLFPFIFLSGFIASMFIGQSSRILRPVFHWLGIPDGGESMFLVGILGGYPTGAKIVYEAYEAKQITKETASRLLGFCNNAGPAFIFGIVSRLFVVPGTAWSLWLIHILSSLITAALLPHKANEACQLSRTNPQTLSHAMQNSLKTMGTVCGWVIAFRILCSYINKYVFRFFSAPLTAIFCGVLELVNGCDAISSIENDGIRFILVSGILAFGGVCVWMQTISVTKELGTGMYIKGKLMQSVFSVVLATVYVLLEFSQIFIGIVIVICFAFFLYLSRKSCIRKEKTVAKCP